MKGKEKPKKKGVDVRLILFLVLVAIALGFFAYKFYEENKIPENLNISSKYHYVPYKTLVKESRETPIDRIEFREYHMVCGNFDDLSCYVKNSPFSYRKENESYRLSIIRIHNDYLENIRVFYKREYESDYKVAYGMFLDVNYNSTMKKKGNIYVNLLLERGRYCFYIEALNKNKETIRSDVRCKWIGPFDPEEDKFTIYGKSGYHELLLQNENLEVEFLIKRLREINGKLVIKDLANKKSFEFNADEILAMQSRKAEIENYFMFGNALKVFFNENVQVNATRVYLKKGNKLEDITLRYEEIDEKPYVQRIPNLPPLLLNPNP